VNFARDVVDATPNGSRALVEISRQNVRREWTFAEFRGLEAAIGTALRDQEVRQGDVVMTLIGNRPEWVATLVACFRSGAIALPCAEQLRADDLRQRLSVAQPKVIVADERNREEVEKARPDCPIVWVGAAGFTNSKAEPQPSAELSEDDPCLITFTSGTTGKPKAALHAQRYLNGQQLQAEHWLGAQPGDLVWCTAASGWSKSARNVFIAPWIRGAAALLDDNRFDPRRRLELVEQEQVNVLCMAPTEYRVIARCAKLTPLPPLHSLVAAGEALDAETIVTWKDATGLEIRDGYGQTETGHMTANGASEDVAPGSMGRALPGVELWVEDGELVVDPRTVPTFFSGYLGEPPIDRSVPWRTGDRVSQDEDGRFWFESRSDDIIISAGYRIGPQEVESVLESHAAVSEVAVVGAPDPERGSVVRAVIVLSDGFSASADLISELQDHAKSQSAPYKYPRVIEFADVLPRTSSGKLRRAELRD
jgi:acyl-coenzyme A synthetase/AMP-(fatty) acid ligase